MSDSNSDTPVSPKPIVQYIFCRRDLEWPVGALAAQIAHASVAAIMSGIQDEKDKNTKDYTSPEKLPHMTKYVYGIADEQQLREIYAKLQQEDEAFPYIWMEQPENIPTALATRPMPRSNRMSKLIKQQSLKFL